MLKLIAFPIALLMTTQTPNATFSKETEKQIIAVGADLNPFPKVSRDNLVKANLAQSLNDAEPLQKARAYYMSFRGSWKPDAPKPDPGELAAFDVFSNPLKSARCPKWATGTRGMAMASTGSFTLDTNNPVFKSYCQTKETQSIKALGIVYLTEHRLNRGGALERSAELLCHLIEKTPFDPEVRFLFAEAALDAKDYDYGFYQARIGLYLTENPSREDMEFICYVGAFAGKDKWDSIQATLRLLAKDKEVAESVIVKYAILFGPNARAVTTSTRGWQIELNPKKP